MFSAACKRGAPVEGQGGARHSLGLGPGGPLGADGARVMAAPCSSIDERDRVERPLLLRSMTHAAGRPQAPY